MKSARSVVGAAPVVRSSRFRPSRALLPFDQGTLLPLHISALDHPRPFQYPVLQYEYYTVNARSIRAYMLYRLHVGFARILGREIHLESHSSRESVERPDS